jgi:hypothetical protein
MKSLLITVMSSLATLGIHLCFSASASAQPPASAGIDSPGTQAYSPEALLETGATMRYANQIYDARVDPATNYLYVTSEYRRNKQAFFKVDLRGPDDSPLLLGESRSLSETLMYIDSPNGIGFVKDNLAEVGILELGHGAELPERESDESGRNTLNAITRVDQRNGFIYGFWGDLASRARWTGPDDIVTLDQQIWLRKTYTHMQFDNARGYIYISSIYNGEIVKMAMTGGTTTSLGYSGMRVASEWNFRPDLGSGLLPLDIDETAGTATYVAMRSGYKLVRFRLGEGDEPPTIESVLNLNMLTGRLRSALRVPGTRYALLATDEFRPARIIKVDIGDSTTAPRLIGWVALPTGDRYLEAAGYSPLINRAVFYNAVTGRFVKIDPGVGDALPRRTAGSEPSLLLHRASLLLSDPYADYALAVTGLEQSTPVNTPSNRNKMIKVALGDARTMPDLRGESLMLEFGQDFPLAGVLDATGGYAYVSFDQTPGVVNKYAMGEPSQTPRIVGSAFFEADEGPAICAVIDRARNQALFATRQSPAKIVKLALGDGDTLPTPVGTITLEPGEDSPRTAVFDEAGGCAYFGTSGNPGRVVKVAIGAAGAPPVRVGAVTLPAGEGPLGSSALHAADRYALFGSSTSPGRVIKVGLGETGEPPVRINSLTLPQESRLTAAVIDPDANRAYFGASMTPARVVSLALGGSLDLPIRLQNFTLPHGEDALPHALINPAGGTGLFGGGAEDYSLHRMLISQKWQAKLTQFTLPERGAIDALKFYSHIGLGSVRLGLYREVAPDRRELVWESASIPNTVNGGWLEAPIAAGTPTALTLNPGTYCFAWQVNTTANVPSRKTGTLGEGSCFTQAYGPFPATLQQDGGPTAWRETDEVWSGYVGYRVSSGAGPVWLRLGD